MSDSLHTIVTALTGIRHSKLVNLMIVMILVIMVELVILEELVTLANLMNAIKCQ